MSRRAPVSPMSRPLACLVLLAAALVAVGVAESWGGPDPTRPGETTPLTKSDIDAMMTSLSNWGRWGKDDQLGALNLITAEKRRSAAALVKEGGSISLAHAAVKEPLDESPAFVHRMVALPERGQEATSAADEYSVRYHG